MFLLNLTIVNSETVNAWLNDTLWGNSVRNWLVAVVTALIAIPVIRIIQKIITARLAKLAKRTPSQLDDLVVNLIRSIRLWLIVAAVVYFVSVPLVLPNWCDQALRAIAVVAAAIQLLSSSVLLIDFLINVKLEKASNGDPRVAAAAKSASGVIRILALLSVGVIIILLALDNMGVKVTPLITGLGIGGVAVALAAQSFLADIFASLTILLDKPFLVGDFIIAGQQMGTIEHIGIKTTRVRALSGEQLIFTNSDLLGSRIQNFKRMQERRVVFTVGIIYETPYDLLSRTPEIIRQCIASQKNVRIDRVNFKGFGNFSLDFEMVYYVLSADYNQYMNIQEGINLELFKRFQAAGLSFAYPTAVSINKMDTAALGPDPTENARAMHSAIIGAPLSPAPAAPGTAPSPAPTSQSNQKPTA